MVWRLSGSCGGGMIHTGDCVEVMRTMPDASVDAVVTDPPYGLEFMGKEWDRFRVDDPGTTRNRGERAGAQGGADSTAEGRGAFGRVAYGGGKHPMTSRCAMCGKRDQFRNPHSCGPDAEWTKEPINPDAAPPTMLAFQEWCREWAVECKRVLKPGGYLLAFGGTRTVHRLASAIEDAGFEIRDELVWIYASGFPKSLDVGKAMDKLGGVDTTADERWRAEPHFITGKYKTASGNSQQIGQATPGERHVYEPTEAGAPWKGWGTALKPAHEPIVMARKPLVGTVAGNVAKYGTGALNIDGTRIPGQWTAKRNRADGTAHPGNQPFHPGTGPDQGGSVDNGAGRWPSNVLLSDPELFDEPNPGVVGSGATATSGALDRSKITAPNQIYGARPDNLEGIYEQDSGGYSRFFIVPKADRADREPVLRGTLEKRPAETLEDNGGNLRTGSGNERNAIRENAHPTVKPTDLMRHLVRLVTPPGGTVLDPFLGSGSTAIACELEGFPWIGIEKEESYVEIANARLNGIQRGFGLDVEAPSRRPSRPAPQQRAPVVRVDLELFPGMAGTTERDEVA